MKWGVDRYRYIATHVEYCNFCLELLARGAISQHIKATLIKSCGTQVKPSYTRFTGELTKALILRLRKRYGIRCTVTAFTSVMDRARTEYEQSDGDLDHYYASEVVQEFKVRFLGNQLDNWDLLDEWVEFFGATFPDEDERYEVLGSLDLVISLPAFDIYDIPPVTMIKVSNALTDVRFNSHYWRYFKAPIFVIQMIHRECPGVSIRFTPVKFMLLGYSLSYIAMDHRRYRTNQDKHKSVFKLIEFVFGTLTSRELIWITHSVFCWIPRLAPARGLALFHYDDAGWKVALESIKHLGASESDYRLAFDSLEIVKGVQFTPEVKESLKIYRAEKENAT